MKEYIEREVVINTFCEDCERHSDENPFACSMCENVKEIMKIPAADVEPVRHGRWLEQHGESYLIFPIKYDEDGLPVLQPYISYECSECGKVVSKQYPYCNCGAKMDGGKKI